MMPEWNPLEIFTEATQHSVEIDGSPMEIWICLAMDSSRAQETTSWRFYQDSKLRYSSFLLPPNIDPPEDQEEIPTHSGLNQNLRKCCNIRQHWSTWSSEKNRMKITNYHHPCTTQNTTDSYYALPLTSTKRSFTHRHFSIWEEKQQVSVFLNVLNISSLSDWRHEGKRTAHLSIDLTALFMASLSVSSWKKGMQSFSFTRTRKKRELNDPGMTVQSNTSTCMKTYFTVGCPNCSWP